MVAEVRPEYPSDWPAIVAVAQRLGIGSAETLRKWYRQAEVDGGQRPGVTSQVTPPSYAPNATGVVHATATMGKMTRQAGITVTVS